MASEGGDGPDIQLSKFELLLVCHPPILESILLHASTSTIFKLYHTSSYLRQFLRGYPTAWKHLSFRLLQPSTTPPHNAPGTGSVVQRQSRNYALDQLLLHVVNPFSTCLKSLELDNTAISGQILISTVLSLRRESLEHVSVRGCKNVSLKYHIVPWLTILRLQATAQGKHAAKNPAHQPLALKSLYTYRCRHHRRRPYLPTSLTRKDSDSEPTHELVTLCHQLGIWTDTAWCTTPGVRCFRRRGYLSMRAPVDTKEVWVVYDRLWRSKNWVGAVDEKSERASTRDGRFWEQDDDGQEGEALGVADGGTRYNEGKHLPMHLRHSHREFIEGVSCDNCSARILERCEQCSVLMHCAGCRKSLCASCAFERPYTRNKPEEAKSEGKHKFWWAPGCSVSPCSMPDQDDPVMIQGQATQPPNPASRFKWCCTEPVFSGGGGITFGPGNSARDYEKMRAAPLPRGQGWEDSEFRKVPEGSEDDRFPPGRAGLKKNEQHYAVLHHLLGGPEKQTTPVPRNLCDECHSSQRWKVKCNACSQSLCLQHDLRGLKMRVCGYKDLIVEKESILRRQNILADFWSRDHLQPDDFEDTSSTSAQIGLGTRLPQLDLMPQPENPAEASSSRDNDRPPRPTSPSSNATAAVSRSTSPAPSVDSVLIPTPTAEKAPAKPSEPEDPHPNWLGCLGFACSPYRSPGDHRMRCTASFKECTTCKVQVCKTCTDGMMKPCRCEGCAERNKATPTTFGTGPAPPHLNANPPTGNVPPPAPTVANPPAPGPPTTASIGASGVSWETTKFWCPNCRWTRIQDGLCKSRRPAKGKGKGKGKGKEKAKEKARKRSSTGSDATARPAPVPSGIDDETAQNVAEFEGLIERLDGDIDDIFDNESGPSAQLIAPLIPLPAHGHVATSSACSSADTPTILPPLPLSAIAEEESAIAPEASELNNSTAINLDLAQVAQSLNEQPPSQPETDSQLAPLATRAEHEAMELDLDRVSALVADLQARVVILRAVFSERRQQLQDPAMQTGEAAAQAASEGNQVVESSHQAACVGGGTDSPGTAIEGENQAIAAVEEIQVEGMD